MPVPVTVPVPVPVTVPVPVAVGEFLGVVIAGGERSERAKRASEALWCFLWVSMAHCACTALLLSGTFLCLLLLLWVLLLLLVLLPLVGEHGPVFKRLYKEFQGPGGKRTFGF